MKIITYLINLDSSNDRLESASMLLEAQNIPFERFAAVDGRGKPLSSFENYNDTKAQKVMGRSLLNGELGCYLSHVGCVEKFLKSDADYLVVLEDDMTICEDFKKTLDDMLIYLSKEYQRDWYLINIGAKKKKMYKPVTSIQGHKLIRAYYFPIRTIGLVWSRPGSKAFLEAGREIYMPIDNFMQSWLSQNGKGLSIWEPLVKPSGFESEIDIHRSDKKAKSFDLIYKNKMRILKSKLSALRNMWSVKNPLN
ncbi:glycosyltransferase family 25 protein [Acinetobacter sp. YH12255]|uniref:glycosyltransferase family 25 protein n=1 Tax=Acinetobacter sp. YH12255 TaxID=2601179 RepID=UPI0015D40866